MVAGDMLERFGLVALGIFVWRTFRPESLVALFGAGLCGAIVAAEGTYAFARQHWPHDASSGPAAWATQLVFALPFVWSAAEAGIQYARSRRQLALGLTDALVCNRFLLWCLGCASFAGICGVAIAGDLAARLGQAEISAAAIWIRAALHASIAVWVWLGMFSPASYRRWVEDRTAASATP